MKIRWQLLQSELVTHLRLLGLITLLLWALEAVDQVFWHGQLDYFGIYPRTWLGLRNILLAPLLHRGFTHLFANTVPFWVLGWFVLLRGVWEFWLVTLLTAVVSGLGVWLFGMPATVHIGLSGVLFGYLGFLLLRGYFERSTPAIVLALLAGLLYGSMIWGILPLQPNVSWLGHLFGLVGGGLAAYLLTRFGRRDYIFSAN
ncbi:MAG: rhomboid family intramembrane serine protease [Caldilineaceae bacterium]